MRQGVEELDDFVLKRDVRSHPVSLLTYRENGVGGGLTDTESVVASEIAICVTGVEDVYQLSAVDV